MGADGAALARECHPGSVPHPSPKEENVSGITLSPKYGLNPAVPKCYYCLQDKSEVVIPGRIDRRVPNRHGIDKREVDIEAPRGAIWDMRPCSKCAAFMQKGVILISIRDTEEPPSANEKVIWNPFRTGGFAVMPDPLVQKVFASQPELVQMLLKHRYGFISDTAWGDLGFPRPVAAPIATPTPSG